MSSAQPMGIIAGEGRLPFLVADGVRRAGLPVHAIGIVGSVEPGFAAQCDRYSPVALLRVGSWARKLRRMGVSRAIMVGRVNKSRTVHDPLRLFRQIPDLTTALVWYRRLRHDRRSPAILAAVADALAQGGVTLIDSTTYIPDQLASPGVMTRTSPAPGQLADIEFGWPLFREILRLDIGQAVAVRERDVLAVEAIEGTDRMIERAGALCRRGGWTLLKGARETHDRRADVPTIGESTVRAVHAAGGRCIALAPGDVILIDRERTLALADELGIAVVGVERGGRPADASPSIPQSARRS